MSDDPIPATLEEAVEYLLRHNSLEHLEKVFGKAGGIASVDGPEGAKRFLGMVHHGFGTNLRNAWKLWHKGTVLNQWFRDHLGLWHADDMSSIILNSFHARVYNYPYDPQADVERFKAHWAKYGINSIEEADDASEKGGHK